MGRKCHIDLRTGYSELTPCEKTQPPTGWNPADERLLLPRAVGWGWDLNLGAVAVRLGLIEPDAESVPFTSTGDSAFRLAATLPVALAAALYATGALLERVAPGLGTSGPQLLVWGFFVSTVLLFHATVTINSLAHRWGRRRYDTRDDSRNNLWLALLTFGEGWHNNHHFFPGSARQGFRWWEIDLTWYGLRALQALGLVRDLKPVPAWVLERRER